MPLPHLPPGYQHLWSWYNRLQNRYKYRDQGRDLNLLRTMRAAYYAAVSFIDHNMGRVLDWLQKSGELDNTLIVHTSDHGEFLGDYDCYGKRSFLDVAARVPLLVRYPAAFEPGQRCDQPVSLVDFGPTCLAAAGAPACTEHVGEDLAAVAAGSSDREYVIGQIGREDRGMYMLCARDFKYIYSAPDDAEWLLPRIAGELESRSVDGNPAYRNVQQEMRQALIDHFRADGYETPLEGDGWKRFPAPPLEAHPDGNLLYQDGRKVDDCFPDGYAPRVRPGGGLPALSQR